MGWACGSSPRGSTWGSQPRRRATAKSSPPVFWPATTIRPLRRQRDRVAERRGPEVDGRLAGGAERGVRRAVGVQARDRDVLAGLRVAGDDDLAVRLQRRAARRGRRATPKSIVAVPPLPKPVSGEPSGFRRVTVIVALPPALPATTILRSGCTSTALTLPPPGSVTRPSPPKSGSSAAGRAQPRHHGAGGRRPSGDEDAPVGLARHRLAEFGAAEVDRRDAGGAEGRVERAVGVQARDLDVAALGPREAAEQDLAVRRHDHGGGAADRAPAEDLLAVAVEAGVERAVGLQAHDGGLSGRESPASTILPSGCSAAP